MNIDLSDMTFFELFRLANRVNWEIFKDLLPVVVGAVGFIFLAWIVRVAVRDLRNKNDKV